MTGAFIATNRLVEDLSTDGWIVVDALFSWGGTDAYRWASQMKKKHPGGVILRARQWPKPSGPLFVYIRKETQDGK